MLRMLPRILRFVPGAAQDVRAYFLTLQYLLAGSDNNVANLVRLLVDRYADGPRAVLRGTVQAQLPAEYPEVGVYHPRMKGRIGEQLSELPRAAHAKGTVGLLVMRSYVLAGNSQHYDGVIVHLACDAARILQQDAAHALVQVEAGLEWDALVDWTLDQGLQGLENLALIPGQAGAAPIQNIGAYGLELVDRFDSLNAWDFEKRRFFAVDRGRAQDAVRSTRTSAAAMNGR
jgi:hypothetical protein